MQHILVFTTAYLPHIGGAEIAVQNITRRLSEKFRFTIITYRFSDSDQAEEEIEGVRILRLGTGSTFDRLFLFPILAFWQAKKLVKSDKEIKLLWGVMVSYASIGAYFLRLANPHLKFLLTLQEGDSEDHLQYGKLGMLGFWWKRLVRKADHIQAISPYLAARAQKIGAKCPVEVVPNGVDLDKFRFLNATQKKKSKEKIITTTSRLVEKNGIDILISAIEVLKKKFPTSNYRLRIIGEGPLEEELKAHAKKLRVDDLIEFVGGVPPYQVPIEFETAQIFVRPSRSEGLGNSFLEAMATGTPIIGTAVGGIPVFLNDGETGLFSKVDDPTDLAMKIEQLFSNQALQDKLIANGRKLVEDEYSWQNVCKKMEVIFQKLT